MNAPNPNPAPHLEAVAKVFRALSETSRLEILHLILEKPRTVSDIVEALHSKQANVSKQLGVLHDAGLVTRSRDANFVRYSARSPLAGRLCDIVCKELREEFQKLSTLLAATAQPHRAAHRSG